MIPSFELRAIIQYVTGHYTTLKECSVEEQQKIQAIILKRQQGMPLAKIIGYKEFWKDRFITTMDTLDPRPDSETMIEAVLETCPLGPYRILDLGTGTGCLLLSLLRQYPDATGVGVDISPQALAVSRKNGVNLGLDDRVTWLESSWCKKVTGQFDIIIANPPYVGRNEDVNLGATFDPEIALYGGIHTYDEILKSIQTYLGNTPCRYLFFEIGYQQAKEVGALLTHYGYKLQKIKKDLAEHDRILISFGLE